jgi:hypothetical protein
VSVIVELIASVFSRHRLLFAIQVYEHFDRSAISELPARFDTSTIRVYRIDEPGRNHGLALLTAKWIR